MMTTINDLEPTSRDHEPRHCPKCRVQMGKRTNQGITVDQCPDCRGLWFDMHELKALRALQGSEALDSSPASTADDAVPSSSYRCPDHDQPLVRISDPQQPHIHMEKCSICYGVFLDAGEFRDLKDFSAQEFLSNVFSRLRA